MSIGPLELVSIATPTGTPLRLAITYNSRNQLVGAQRGALGVGWTLNTEQRVSTAGQPMYWSELGRTSLFPAPAQPAAIEPGPLLPDARYFTRSQGGANLGFYFADHLTVCPDPSGCTGTPPEPRVVFEDGSTALFSASGAFVGLRDLAGNEQQYFSLPAGPSTPAQTGLRQGSRSVALHRYSVNRTDVVATVGSTPEITVARLVLDGNEMSDNYLTDICVPAAPLGAPTCASPACTAAGMRSLYRFQYVAVPQGPRRLSEVTDEDCKVVEQHDYKIQDALGVVAFTSVSATESLHLEFHAGTSPTRVGSVDVAAALAPATTVLSSRTIDDAANRVGGVTETCGCGSNVARAWGALDGVPVIDELRQGLTTSVFSYGNNALDPFRFGRPTAERQDDEHAGAWGASPSRNLTFAYQHPLVRSPTLTTQPGNGTADFSQKVSAWDYDDDDQNHPCREGLPQAAGSPSIPNEHPTRFLCRVADGSRVTHFRYDELGRLKRSDGPDGVPVTYEYWPENDANQLRAGLLKSVTRGDTAGLLSLTTTFEEYHFTGRPMRIVNANNEVTSYVYDLQGRVTQMVAADTSVTLTEYAAGNKPSKVTLPSRVTIHTGYDAFGRAQDVTWRTPTTLGSTILQRLHRTFDLGGNVLVEETFDGNDVLTRRSQRDYDEAHRVTREYGLTATVWKSFKYHDGVLTQSTDEGGRVSSFEYDGFGRLRRTLRLLGGGIVPAPPITHYNYDVMDNLAEVIDANGNPTRYVYNDYGQTLEVTTLNSGTTSYDYAGDGALLRLRTGANNQLLLQLEPFQELTYTWDALRRPVGEIQTSYRSAVQRCTPPPTVVCTPDILSETALVTYGYDSGSHAKGRLSQVTFPGGTRAFTWDDAGRIQGEVATLTGLATTLPLTRTYHPGGALASVTYPRQTSTSRPPLLEYDKALDETVSEVRFGGVRLARDVTHYPFGGGMRSLVRGNDLTVSWSEDLLGRRFGSSGVPVNLGYELDARGDVQLAREGGDRLRMRDYDYDAEHRLTSAVVNSGPATAAVFSETYSYDEVGNRLLKVRNGSKSYVSVFDWKNSPTNTVPANDLLRAVVDPPVAGQCVPVDGGMPRGDDGDEGDDGHPEGGHQDDGDEQGQGHFQHGQGHGYGHGEAHPDGGASADGGLPFCAMRSAKELARLDSEWKAVMHEARKLVRDAPRLSADEAHNRLLSVLEKLRAWMEKYDVPTPALLGVLAGASRGMDAGAVDFATTLSAYLARRASGTNFGQADLDLLETLVKLAEKADVRQAVENDPTWRYTHDANGAVTSVTVEIPEFVLVPADPGGPFQTPALVSPRIHNTMCYRYDARQRLVQVEAVVRGGAQVSSTTAPCEDAARMQLAVFRYDEANRRVYANVAGKETWELRGSGGELLAEVSQAGEVERAYVYLDGEPLTVVALRPGKALRSPTTPLGCSSTGSGSLVGLVVLMALLRRRRGRAGLLSLFLLLGCDSQGPQPEPPPAPGVGQLEGEIFYFHNDRLGTPVRLTNQEGATVWRADYRPFGDVQSLETDVDGDGVHIEQPLRFPGQYEDAMSGLILAQGPYYNWNRHYEPATGRYLSPEPMLQNPSFVRAMAHQGLATPSYAYANNNPLHYTDPTGLCIGPFAGLCLYLGLEAGAVGLAELGLATAAGAASICIGTSCLGPGALSPEPPMPPNIPSGAEGGSGSGNGTCAAAGATAAAAKIAECIARATKAMNMCLSQGKTVAQCSYAYDVAFALCMGNPIPPWPPSVH